MPATTFTGGTGCDLGGGVGWLFLTTGGWYLVGGFAGGFLGGLGLGLPPVATTVDEARAVLGVAIATP